MESRNRDLIARAKDFASREGKDFLKKDLVGADEWERSKLGYLLGFGAVRKGAATTWRSVSALGRYTAAVGMAALGRDRAPPLPTDSTDPAERFRVAQWCYERTDDEVAEMVRRSQRQFTLFFVLLTLALGWGIVSVGATAAALPFGLGYPFAFSLVVALLPLAMRAAFWNWQLRTRRLGSFAEWLRSPGEWMPPDPDGSGGSGGSGGHKAAAWLLAFAATVLLPATALAADAFDWTNKVAEDDLFQQMLQIMLPGVGPIPSGGVGTNSPYAIPLDNAFGAFNASLLMLATMMLGWHTLSGTVATAHEGKVLGQRWHQIWAPLRVTLGVGFLAPVSGGYCAAQLLVLQLIVWGGGLANHVWGAYLDTFEKPKIEEAMKAPGAADAMGGVVISETAKGLLRTFAEKEICYYTIKDYEDRTGKPVKTNQWFGRSKPVLPDSVKLDKNRPVYADAAAEALAKAAAEDTRGVGESYAVTMAPSPRYYINVWDYGPVCGSVQLDGGTMEAAAKDSKLTNAVKAASIRREVAKEIAEAIEEARPFVQAYAMNFVAAVRGNRPVQPLNLDDIPADMKNGFEKYRAAWAMIGGRVSALLRQEMGGTLAGDMVAEAKRLGWASSGMFYVTLSRTQAAAAELSKFSPSSTPVKVDLVDNTDLPVDLFGEKGPGAKKGVGTLEQFASVWEQYITPPPGVNTELSMAGLTESNSIEWINSKMVWALEQTVHTLKIDPFNPMAGMVSFGHTILNLFSIAIMIWMLVVGGAAAGAAIGAAGAAAAGPAGVAAGGILGGATGAVLGVLGSALAPIGFLIKMALLAILGVGIVHAYVLPMIPYIMTTFAVTGMMILTVEAMVAAPLWAWFHVRLDGQDFVDQVQKPGYMIAFNLVLRPTLIIFGLILSMGVFGASMWFINSTFLMTALTGVAGHTLGPIGILTFLVIMGYMHYQVAIRSFTLITQVPDRVTRWFGQGGENLGEENDAKHSSQFIVANVSSKFEGMARGAGARAAFGGRSSAPKGDPGNGQQGQQGQQQGQAKNEGEGL